ncbi:MAG: protein kinase domain-containing protein, partial [Planctomycetota bacterium]
HEQAGDFLESPVIERDVTLDTPPQIEGPGTRIGHYELLELIGEGGMGLVYLAEQKEPVKRRVALKIIKPGMDSKQVIARFEAERQILALLDHPNIAHVLDAGTTGTGRPYFVMEYVKGLSITQYCDQNKLNIEQRLKLFRQTCEGVHHAHQKGIIHRDLKPSNILVSVHGDRVVPKIIDFGIAKATSQPLTDKTVFTYQGQLLGTPEYMSPEQVDLAVQDIDIRSDIYSLGVVLYELLAGVLPFEQESLARLGFAEVQRTIREQEPASPSIRLSGLGEQAKTIAESRRTQVVPLARCLHRELEWIPLKAIRKDRCRRYRSAAELADDVQNYLDGNPLIAGPETAVYRVKKFVRRHAGSVATAALIAVIIILGLVVSTVMYLRAEDARQKEATARAQAEQATRKEAAARAEAEQAKEKETVARTKAEQAEQATKEKAEELRRTLYVNSIQLADAKHREGNPGRVRDLLASCPNDLRGWEWNRLNYIQDESLKTLRVGSLPRRPVISQDGRRIITCGEDKAIRVWDLETRQQLMTLGSHNGSIYALAVSPDGKHIASGGDDNVIKLWDAQTGAEVMTLRGHRAPVLALAFSPDGRRLASGSESYDGTIMLWDARTGARLKTLRGQREIYALAFSPDGKRMASGSGDDTIKLWDVQTGAEVTTLSGHDHWVMAVAFSPEGKRIASGSYDKTIKIWDAETGDALTTIVGHEGPVLSVALSPDGELIASGGWDNGVKVWDGQTGEEIGTLQGHDWSVYAVSFSENARHIVSASADGAVKLWDVITDRESSKFHGYSSRTPRSVAFSPDGRQIAADGIYSYYGGTITLWDAQTGEAIRTIRGHRFFPWSVAFSPDGRRIVSGESGHRVARVWDALTGAQLMALGGHKGAVRCVAVSPDGKYIISGSYDKTIKLWDAASGSEVMTFQGHTRDIRSVAFSPDG